VRTVGQVAAIGTELAVRGFGLAGAVVCAAEDDEAARRAWRDLPDGIDLVILTGAAAAAIGAAAPGPASTAGGPVVTTAGGRLTVVLPGSGRPEDGGG
jgi:vacuolar-type H+-ATPase subunit F/Vma7